jgi:uncharacterized HAD superfamily protein
MAVIFDIDGTLADCTHRLHYIQGEQKRYNTFYNAMDKDMRIKPIASLAMDLSRSTRIIMATGRPESHRDMTLAWLEANNIPCHDLYMRRVGDFRPDYVVKKEMLDAIKRHYPVDFAIDDSPAVIEMFNSNGVLCLAMPRSETK